jgi:hypothetical protein
MSALQTYYTSSRMGRNGYPGFGFNSVSLGIAPSELDQIAPLGELTLPRDLDLPPLPQAELAAATPVLLRFRALPTGRWAVIRSRYVGSDYSRLRGGNYFAHGLLFNQDDWAHLGGLWPVDLAAWSGWQDRLAVDDGVLAPDLPAVELAEFTPAADLTPAALARFLSAIPDAAVHLAALLRAAFARQGKTNRAILIRERAERALPWVACIQKAFPRQVAGALSFCTYQYEALEAEAINVSVGETNFRFDDADFNYRYFTFDHLSGRHSEVPSEGAEYAACIAGWMVGKPAQLVAFHDFMDLFDLAGLDNELTLGLRLFHIEQGTLVLPDGAALLELLAFAQGRTRPNGRCRVLMLLADRLAAVASDLDAASQGTLVAFLAEGARATGQPADRERAVNAWLGMFDALVIERGTGLEATATARDDLLRRLPAAAPELARRFVATPRLDALYPKLVKAPLAVASAFVREVIGQLAVLDPAGAWPETPSGGPLSGLASAASDPAPLLDLLLGSVAGQPTALLAACRVLTNEFVAEAVDHTHLEALGRSLGRLPMVAVRPIRSVLDQMTQPTLLRAEWQERLATTKDPYALFNTYEAQDLPLMSVFSQTETAFVRSRCWLTLPESEALSVARDWLLTGQLADLEDKTLAQAVARLNDTLPIENLKPSQRQIVSALGQLVSELGLRLAPNRPLILATAAELRSRDAAGRIDLIARLAGQLDGLPERDYRGLLKKWLEPSLVHCNTAPDHCAVLEGLYSPDHTVAFLDAYGAALSKLSADGLINACRCWLTEGDRVPLNLLEPVLAARLRKLKPNARDNLVQVVGKDKGLTKAARSEWQALLASVEQPPGMLARAAHSVGRLFGKGDQPRGKGRH